MTKTKKQKWIKKRHKVTFKILRGIFKPFFNIRYRLKPSFDENKIPKPALIMANHQTTYDQFMVMCSFSRPIYLIASEDLFMNPVLGPLMKYFTEPIAKSKSKSDVGTILNTMRVLKEGGTVALFPEGNRTLSGGSWKIDLSTAKLVKSCKVPLALYKIDGGYGTDPRWGGKIRRGKMSAKTVEIISAERINSMTVEEIYDKICSTLASNDFESGVKFKSRRRAEFLERALYYCPNCGSFESLYSKGNYLYCKNCEMTAEYTEDLKIKALSGVLPYNTVYEWFNAEQLKLKERLNRDENFCFNDQKLSARTIVKKKWHGEGKAKISAFLSGIEIEVVSGKIFKYSYEELLGMTVLGKRKINFYLPNKTTLQIVGGKRFCGVKYLHLFECVKENKDE